VLPAGIGAKDVAVAAGMAGGWLPTIFSPAHMGPFRGRLEEGFARGGRDREARDRFRIAPLCPVLVGDDLQACRDMLKPYLALYVGGMGARGRNFYTDLVARYGYEAEARQIQDLYLEGRKGE